MKLPLVERSRNEKRFLIMLNYLINYFLGNEFRIAISKRSDTYSHIVLSKDRKGKIKILSCGSGIGFWTRIFFPLTATIDMGNIPAVIKREELGEEDPDHWVDGNEEKIIPSGFTSDQVVTEFTVDGSSIYCALVKKDSINTLLQSLDKNIIPGSIRLPLWDLARLYGDFFDTSFLLWKISSGGSVIGFAKNGKLNKLCNYWADRDDLDKEQEKIKEELEKLFKSIIDGNECKKVILFSDDKKFKRPDGFTVPEFELLDPPSIKGVPAELNELYALALQNSKGADFIPFETAQKAKMAVSIWKKINGITRVVTAVVLICILLMMSINAGFRLSSIINKDKFQKLESLLDEYGKVKAGRDSLLYIFKADTKLLNYKSNITPFFSDLQKVFPEGCRAEEILLTEESEGRTLEIRGLTNSRELIKVLMDNLQKEPKISSVRLVYSEQAEIAKNANALRFKIEGKYGE